MAQVNDSLSLDCMSAVSWWLFQGHTQYIFEHQDCHLTPSCIRPIASFVVSALSKRIHKRSHLKPISAGWQPGPLAKASVLSPYSFIAASREPQNNAHYLEHKSIIFTESQLMEFGSNTPRRGIVNGRIVNQVALSTKIGKCIDCC
nr:hypothetical protein CFP56_00527 [Quercus suber]